MAINNFQFKLDIEKEDYIPKFRLKQYDTAIFYVSIYKNGLPYHFENEQIKMFVKKSDGTIVYQEDNISIQDDEVKINVNNQALVCSGLTYAELEFKSSDGQVTSSTFLYEVKEKVGSDKAIESVTDIATLDKLKKYMEDAKKELERFKIELSKIEDLVANKDKLEGQNKEAKENIGELEKILEDANNITSDEGKYIVGNNIVSESTNGYIQDLKLYGKSLVNECDFKRNFKGSITGFRTIAFSTNKPIPNTEYTFIFKNKSNNDVSVYANERNFYFSKTFIVKPNETIIYKITSLPESVETNDPTTLFKINADGITVNVDFDLMFLKGDYTQSPPSYFEGIASVGNGNEIEALSRKEDGNIFNINAIPDAKANGSGDLTWTINGNRMEATTTRTYQVNHWYHIKVAKGERYTLSAKDLKAYTHIYEGKVVAHTNAQYKGGINTTTIKKFSFTSNSEYITLRVTNELELGNCFVEELMLTMGEDAKPYVKYEADKKTVLFKDTDNNWKPVTNLSGYWENGKFVWGDTVELHPDGKYYYHKRLQKDVFDGSREWTVIQSTGNNNTRCYSRFDGKYIPLDNNYILCDKINLYNTGNINENCIGIDSNGNIVIGIKNSLLPTPDSNGLKKYLQQNHMTLISRLPKEEVYECLDISLRAFRNKTMLSIDSGAINPGLSYYVPTGFLSADNSISEKVKTLDKYSEKNTTDIDKLNSNLEQNYFNINLGSVTDFNTATKEGKHIVGSAGDIPHAPYIDPGMGIYGVLEVLYKGNECIQRFTSNICKMFVRFRNYKGDWSTWNRTVSDKDFTSNIDSQGTGYQYLPNGTLIQWGTTTVNFDSVKGSAIIRYPITYKEYCKCTGNLESNDYGSYSETNAVVGGQTLSQGFCEVRDINGSSRAGKIARVTWIVIGR
ncbi:BppU family phage baseplate upper protein [Paraclostridium bifermentans]|uniref:BppU family phage baseplate upper protein n=1 Tax=Paraclostridium bifermentans TaxID=1490 RepID=UPI001898E460|nr:BppU family phage baseplate upper protein [Paraclostridium bifermentans]